jgi:hypothetical protein
MGKRIKSEKKGGEGGGEESKFIEEYTPLVKHRTKTYQTNLKI